MPQPPPSPSRSTPPDPSRASTSGVDRARLVLALHQQVQQRIGVDHRLAEVGHHADEVPGTPCPRLGRLHPVGTVVGAISWMRGEAEWEAKAGKNARPCPSVQFKTPSIWLT